MKRPQSLGMRLRPLRHHQGAASAPHTSPERQRTPGALGSVRSVEKLQEVNVVERG